MCVWVCALQSSSYLCVYDLEFPKDVVWVFIYSMKDDLVLSEIRGSGGWPIPVALYPASLSLLSQHHYCSALLFPYHSPEVITCIWKWALSSYEGFSLVVTLCMQNSVMRHRICNCNPC